MVRLVGLEPTRPKSADFKSAVYTDSTTVANWSDMQDSNLRPSAPKADALPD